MFVYSGRDLIPIGYTDSNFQSDKDSRKSTSGSMFTFSGRAIVWRSIKQSCFTDSIIKVEYVASCEVAKEAVWLHKFLTTLKVIPDMDKPLTLYYDNNGAVTNSKELMEPSCIVVTMKPQERKAYRAKISLNKRDSASRRRSSLEDIVSKTNLLIHSQRRYLQRVLRDTYKV